MTAINRVSTYAKVLGTNSTSTNYPSRVATATEPTGAGVLDMSVGNGLSREKLVLIPYGQDEADKTLKMMVLGWQIVSDLWVPVSLCELTCTLCNKTGVAAKSVLNTEFFCDTLALTAGYSTTACEVNTPTGDVIAHAVVNVKGYAKVEVIFDRNSSATSANALYKVL